MNFNYAIASLFTFTVCSIVGVFIFVNSRHLLANRFYSFLSFSTALWAIGIFMHAITVNSAECLFWARFSHIGASFIPVFYLLFILELTKPNIRINRLIVAALAIASFFSVLAFTKTFLLVFLRKFILHNGLILAQFIHYLCCISQVFR